MKAAILYNINDLRYEEIEIPALRNNEALIKIKACGICGSDISRIKTIGTYSYPLIPGHEMSGKIVDINGKPGNFSIGDHVIVIPKIPCMKCWYCKHSIYAGCENYDFLGSRSNGGFAEYSKAPINNLIKIPKNLPFEIAAMLEPAIVALHAIKRTKIFPGEICAVFGAGTIGLMIGQLLKILGSKRVYMIDVREESLNKCIEVGLVNTINNLKTDTIKELFNLTNNLGLDIAYEAAGTEQTTSQAITSLRRNGRIALVGRIDNDYLMKANILNYIMRKEIELYGVWGFEQDNIPHNDWETSLDYINRNLIKVKELITHRIKLQDINTAINMMHERKEYFSKVIIVND